MIMTKLTDDKSVGAFLPKEDRVDKKPEIVVEMYLAPRGGLTYAELLEEGAEIIPFEHALHRLGIKVGAVVDPTKHQEALENDKSPNHLPFPPHAIVWFAGENGYGEALFLHLEKSGQLNRARRSPLKTKAPHDVIRVGEWENEHPEHEIACESVIKAIVVNKATVLPAIGEGGTNGSSGAVFYKKRKVNDLPGQRTTILYDSLQPDPEKAKHQIRAEEDRAELAIEEGRVPYIARLPPPPRKYGKKTWGADDFKQWHGAAALAKVIADATLYIRFHEDIELTSEPVGMDIFISPPTPVLFVIDAYRPTEVSALIGKDGGGKTYLAIMEAVHIALARNFAGHSILRPGPVVFITAEDSKDVLRNTLHNIMLELKLTPAEKKLVAERFIISDVTMGDARLFKTEYGALQPTDVLKKIVTRYAGLRPSQIILDPLMSFSPSEASVNDGMQAIINAARKMLAYTGANIRILAHPSKDTNDTGAVKQGAARGGGAFGAGVRNEEQLITFFEWSELKGFKKYKRPHTITEVTFLTPYTSVMMLVTHKQSRMYRETKPLWFVRSGWSLTQHGAEEIGEEEIARQTTLANADHIETQVLTLVKHVSMLIEKGELHTPNTLEKERVRGVITTRADMRQAIRLAVKRKLLVSVELPEDSVYRDGSRTEYLVSQEPKF